MLKWTRLSENNVPKGEVLALGYQQEMLFGYIYFNKDLKEYSCETEGSELTEVSHFITKEDLLKLL